MKPRPRTLFEAIYYLFLIVFLLLLIGLITSCRTTYIVHEYKIDSINYATTINSKDCSQIAIEQNTIFRNLPIRKIQGVGILSEVLESSKQKIKLKNVTINTSSDSSTLIVAKKPILETINAEKVEQGSNERTVRYGAYILSGLLAIGLLIFGVRWLLKL